MILIKKNKDDNIHRNKHVNYSIFNGVKCFSIIFACRLILDGKHYSQGGGGGGRLHYHLVIARGGYNRFPPPICWSRSISVVSSKLFLLGLSIPARPLVTFPAGLYNLNFT